MEKQLSLNLLVKFPPEPLDQNVEEEWLEWEAETKAHELALIRRQK